MILQNSYCLLQNRYIGLRKDYGPALSAHGMKKYGPGGICTFRGRNLCKFLMATILKMQVP